MRAALSNMRFGGINMQEMTRPAIVGNIMWCRISIFGIIARGSCRNRRYYASVKETIGGDDFARYAAALGTFLSNVSVCEASHQSGPARGGSIFIKISIHRHNRVARSHVAVKW